MEMNGIPILSFIIFLPLAGILPLLLGHGRKWVQGSALGVTLGTLLLTLVPLYLFRPDQATFQLVERHSWIASLGISYHLGIDGLSLFLLPLTGFLMVAAVLVSWNRVERKEQAYYVSFLVLESGMLGVFCALDTVLFYIFWEAMLVPMFLIIGIWGGKNRNYAALKFIIYTMAGSVFLLVGLIVMAFLAKAAGFGFTFDLTAWTGFRVPESHQYWLFLFFFCAFAVKVPLFPFYTWLPDAHVEAPTAGSVILAGVLLKMGVYGIVRFCFPLFPLAVAYFTPLVMALGLIGVVYGALVAFVQDDLKKLVAYSSVSHMGLIVVGVFCLNQAGLAGGILQMLNHGLSTGALFILVGAIYERKKTRSLKQLGGLASRWPIFASFFMVTVLSSVGLPGLNGFAGEFLLLYAAFQFNGWIGALAATTLILGAVYMLWMTQCVLFEKERSPEKAVGADFSRREKLILVPMVAMFLAIGLYPSGLTDRLEATAREIVRMAAPQTAGRDTRTAPVIMTSESAAHAVHSPRS